VAQGRRTPAMEVTALGPAEEMANGRRITRLPVSQTRNGPGVRRGRNAAIRLLQGNALAEAYCGPMVLQVANSSERVMVAIDRSPFEGSLHPGEGSLRLVARRRDVAPRLEAVARRKPGLERTPTEAESSSVRSGRRDHRVTTTEQGAFLTT
jgi:hypothetical protein